MAKSEKRAPPKPSLDLHGKLLAERISYIRAGGDGLLTRLFGAEPPSGSCKLNDKPLRDYVFSQSN